MGNWRAVNFSYVVNDIPAAWKKDHDPVYAMGATLEEKANIKAYTHFSQQYSKANTISKDR